MVNFTALQLAGVVIWDRMLARKEGFQTEDGSNRNAYVEVGVW